MFHICIGLFNVVSYITDQNSFYFKSKKSFLCFLMIFMTPVLLSDLFVGVALHYVRIIMLHRVLFLLVTWRQAPQPELYLLPSVENDSSVCSQSLSTDTSSSSPDHHIYYHPPETCSLPTGTKEPVKFPLIPQCSHLPPPTPSLEEEEEDDEEERRQEEEQSYSCSEAERENEDEGLCSNKPEWPEPPQFVSLNKGKSLMCSNVYKDCTVFLYLGEQHTENVIFGKTARKKANTETLCVSTADVYHTISACSLKPHTQNITI